MSSGVMPIGTSWAGCSSATLAGRDLKCWRRDAVSTIRRHPLPSYFVLTYGITWGGILAYLASLGFELSRIGATEALVIFGFMAAGPSTSGLLLTALLDGRRGLGDLLGRFRRVWVAPRWYTLALL